MATDDTKELADAIQKAMASRLQFEASTVTENVLQTIIARVQEDSDEHGDDADYDQVELWQLVLIAHNEDRLVDTLLELRHKSVEDGPSTLEHVWNALVADLCGTHSSSSTMSRELDVDLIEDPGAPIAFDGLSKLDKINKCIAVLQIVLQVAHSQATGRQEKA